MTNEPQLIDAQCILWNGHRIYWHGTTNKKCRVYTDDDAVSTTKRVEAKAFLRDLAEAHNITLPPPSKDGKTNTDTIAPAVFDALTPANGNESAQEAKEISRIAKQLGGFPKMFAVHGWPNAGSGLAQTAGTLIAERYGSVRDFVTYWDKALAK